MTYPNLSGSVFGRLSVTSESHAGTPDKPGRVWLCRCICGKETWVAARHLRSGIKRSCGCLRLDVVRQRMKEVGISAPLKLPFGQASSKGLYRCYRKKPVSRKVGFHLTFEEFIELTSKPCFYCGCEPGQLHLPKKTFNGPYKYNGIDRKDSSIGYVTENVVTSCGRCNKMKGTMSPEEFIAHVKKISKRWP